MDVTVVPFDPENATREEWRRYHTYRRLRHMETDPDDPVGDDATTEIWMGRPHPHWQDLYLAVLDPERPDSMIGMVYFEMSRPGSPSHETNKHIGWGMIELLRPYRRRGLGRSLLPKIVELARANGRTVLQGWCEEDDGKAFAAAIGARVVQQRRQNRLDLRRVDWSMVQAWADEGPRRSPGTAVRWFVNHIDEEFLEAYWPLFTEVLNQQPWDEQQHGDFIANTESFQEREARIRESKGTWITAVTQEPDGVLSGLTEVTYVPDEATMLWQGLTGVRDTHRGRGLGKWLKALMLLRVREEFPEVRFVVTGNASSNAAMLSINERLGFRTHKEPVVVEMPLEELEACVKRSGLGP